MVQQKIIKFIITLAFLAIGFIFAGGRDNKEAVNEKQISIPGIDTTKLEKYERKVIIKAKVGKGPGEMGVIGEGVEEGPKGIAVDSVGNVFILDQINKRILKFSNRGKYLKTVVLPEIESYLEGLDNHLFVDDQGNFYITQRIINLSDKIKVKYKYDKNGKIVDEDLDMPEAISKIQGKSVSGDISKFTIMKANSDTMVHYYFNDSVKNSRYAIIVYLPKRDGWEYAITPYLFLGFDKRNNAYVTITALENIPVWPPAESMEKGLVRRVEAIVFKYNEKGKLVAVIKERTFGIGREIWSLGDDGALYLLKYSFKLVVTDELPDWVKNDSSMADEQKKAWRRKYMAPDGYVYVIKFSKAEEK